ncbi:AraC family transcriptional regulator [Croceitalea rosinachiae]|uniref:Helix-turn-helix domain-containing protein n=1 Tax=Croceitalea rosinachiae TaxID=3075596 RepID=A0ABU3A960_9FLAO|nr:helix-turn-helix domain-containing protein [Croceitalea sp. F388]MDT0605623.1 helix-turn-helix domain-containing protein [Croceitalea sp. F388]
MITNEFALLFAYLGLFQGLLLFLYLVGLKKGNRKSNLFLAVVIFGLTLRLAKSVLGYHFVLQGWQINLGISGILFAGPFLWFYLITITDKEFSSKVKYIHLVPFLLFVVAIPFLPAIDSFEKYLNYGLVVFHLGIYLGLSIYTLQRNKGNITPKVYLWVKNVLMGGLFVWLFYLLNFIEVNLYYLTGPVFYTFLTYSLTYLLLNREHYELNKYNSSRLNQKTSKELLRQIKQLFESQNVYLDSGVSLKLIAKELNVSSRQVSQAINENEGYNFYEFVNQYRVEQAKLFFKDKARNKDKMETIAYDSGFGNISSFNVAFKKHVGLTPSEFKQIQN